MTKDEILKVVRSQKDTVLSFPERGPFGQSSYRGNCSGFIPAYFIDLLKASSVAEIYAGGGTTSDVCKAMDIPYVGIDLNPNPVRSDIVSMDILDDTAELPRGFYNADMMFLHPPYPGINKVRYSNSMWKDTSNLSTKDIQNMDFENGMKAINKSIMRGYTALPKGSYQVILVGEIRANGNYYSMFRSLALPGQLWQTFVKLQHNTVSDRNRSGYSQSTRALTGQEMIAVIKKPSGFEIAYIIPRTVKEDIRNLNMSTWKDVVMAIMREFKCANLDKIYKALENSKKAASNPHYKDKIRQTLQSLRDMGLVKNESIGVWSLA